MFEQVTDFLSYLPDKQEKEACAIEKNTLTGFRLPDNDKEVYDVKKFIECIADNGKMLEVSKTFARNLVTVFIRLNGMSVGVVANNLLIWQGVLILMQVTNALDLYVIVIVMKSRC